MNIKKIISVSLFVLSPSLNAGSAEVIDVKVSCPSSCTFKVTVKHADSGWDHYANQWQVLTLDGKELGTRVLYHPHEHEQPFTRSLSGVKIPADIKQVLVRAKDSVHGFSGAEKIVDLPVRAAH